MKFMAFEVNGAGAYRITVCSSRCPGGGCS